MKRPGTRYGVSTISSATSTRGRSAGCARLRRSSTGSTAPPETKDELRRRDRPRPDARRHRDVGADRHEGQHVPRGRHARGHGPLEPGLARAEARVRDAACRAPTTPAPISGSSPPTLTYDSFNTQSATTMDYSLQRSWQFSDTLLMVHPGRQRTSRPEVRRRNTRARG